MGQVPIDRADKGSQEAALQTALRVLEKGDALGMYPEGTRSPDGRLYRGKTLSLIHISEPTRLL